MRYLLVVPSGTAIDSLEVAIIDLLENLEWGEEWEKATLEQLRDMMRSSRLGGRLCGRIEFLKLISAIIKVFQIRQVALTCDLNRLDAVVLSRTRENGDSTTFEVRKCFQCSRGKS
jgi:hypothetical protein